MKTVTLSSKGLPGEIESFEDFVSRALSFDFYTDFSDDNRVYQAGNRRREIMDKYAAANELAGKLWERLCDQNLEGFMAGQLITRVENVVLDKSQANLDALSDFVIPYLCTSGADTMIGRSVRNAIGKHIKAPPSYAHHRKDERKAMIDQWVEAFRIA